MGNSEADYKEARALLLAARKDWQTLQENGIKRTREHLATFEAQFDMSAAEMERRLQSGELTETLTTIDWCMELEALRLLEDQYRALSETPN